MKTKLYIIKIIAIMLIIAGSTSSCTSDIDDVTGVWVCSPEPDITITLTFDLGTVYVNTSPNIISNGVSGKQYLFNDGDKYIVHGDTLLYVNPNPNAPAANYGFVGKMISSNKIELHSYGVGFIDINTMTWVTDYSFKRK